jgi:hypothetical protein
LALRGCVAGAVLAVFLHFGYVLVGPNFRTVAPGLVYRCGQPSRARLEQLLTEYKIRTVVNLRGCCPGSPWYDDEAAVTGARGVSLEDLGFSAGRLPAPALVRQLALVLDRSAYPILLHCHQGADRTGLASVLYFLLRTDASLAEARRRLGPSTGHLRVGRTGWIDRFFDLYQDWLTAAGLPHSRAVFLAWLDDYYCPAEGRARFEFLDAAGRGTVSAPRNTPRVVRVRCRNDSGVAWQFRTHALAGLHLNYCVVDAQERTVFAASAGRFDRRVAPGESVDLSLPLPALPPGRFQLRLDLVLPQHATFLQLGNDMLVVDLEVS